MPLFARIPGKIKLFFLPALGAALFFSAGLHAAPTEVPKLTPKVGSGVRGVSLAPANQTGGGLSENAVVPTLDGGSLVLPDAAALQDGPAPAKAARALPAAGPAAPKAFGRKAAPPAPKALNRADDSPENAGIPKVGSEGFQKSLERVRDGSQRAGALASGEDSTEGDAFEAGAAASALFDLAAPANAASGGAVAAVGAGFGSPSRSGLRPNEGTPTRAVIGKLARGAVVQGRGPAAIPDIETIAFDGFASNGNSGETTKVRIRGEQWFLKRIGDSPDPEIAKMTRETRAFNEAGAAAMLRSDPVLSRSYSVSEKVSVFRDGEHIFVLTKGIDVAGDLDSKRRELSPVERADAAIAQLVLGLGDMHGANVLPKNGGGHGLIDFEKLSRRPLETATPQEIDTQVMIKNYPLVDRLTPNDPAVYRARFEAWKSDYESGGRERMTRALRASGWSARDAERYLLSVDKNVASYWTRLSPYLDYANGWYERIQRARAEQARKQAEKPKGFFESLFGGRK
jgi:hypothetical protein